MKIKIVLATATAVSLVMSAGALADNNTAGVKQDGNGNLATIDQSDGRNNVAGLMDNKLEQKRSGANTSATLFNRLKITQSGNSNSVGALGFNQIMDIGSGSTGEGENRVNIVQSSNSNIVGSVSQNSINPSKGNDLTITQSGNGHHVINKIEQSRGFTAINSAVISQSGRSNQIDLISQITTGGDDDSSNRNLIKLDFSGDYNNSSAWGIGSAAAASGANYSQFVQGPHQAINNVINVTVSGDRNKIGITQTHLIGEGFSNSVGKVTISGNANELGVYQKGSDNTLSPGAIAGSGNELGLRQFGKGNSARIDISTGFNGGAHSFTGWDASGFTAGLIDQSGDDNRVSLVVGGGDNNVFALKQDGDLNVGGLEQTGRFNQAALSQIGRSNDAKINQVGNNNNSVSIQAGNVNSLAVLQ